MVQIPSIIQNLGVKCANCDWLMDISWTNVAYNDPSQIKFFCEWQFMWAIECFTHLMHSEDIPSKADPIFFTLFKRLFLKYTALAKRMCLLFLYGTKLVTVTAKRFVFVTGDSR